MRRIALRLLPLLGAAAAVLGLALGSVPASASTHAASKHAPVVHAGVNNQFYSEYLAGQSLDGNGSATFAGIWKQIEVQPETTCASYTHTGTGINETYACSPGSPGVAPDSVAAGDLLEHNLSSGGPAAGEALVLSDIRTATPNGNLTCGANEWTLEGGTGMVTFTAGGFPLPTTDLSPLYYFGAPVCFPANVADSEFMYVYHSSGHFETDFSAGPTSNNWNVLETLHGIPWGARTAAAGITTSTGVNAAQLSAGAVLAPTGNGVFESGHGNSVFGQGINFYKLGYDVWQGTEFGGTPSVSDPETLTVNPVSLVGPYGPSGITAP
jgi:hypothetical protein